MSDSQEFIIPSSLEEMSSTSMGSYMVVQPWSVRQITTVFKEVQNKAIIVDDAPDLVPMIYSAIMNITELSEFALTDLWRRLFKFVNKLQSQLCRAAKENPGPEERRALRNNTTIIIYLFGQIMQAIDIETRKSSASFDVTATKRKKKGPVDVGRFANWDTERITALEALVQLFEMPLREILSSEAADQLGSAMASVLYRLLSNVNVCKDSVCSDLCVQLLTILIVRYSHGALCSYQIPSLMSTSENVVNVLVRVFDEVVNKHSEVAFLGDLIREMSALAESTSGDSLVTKNTAEFLIQICRHLSANILPLIPYIDDLLNSPNFTIRNAGLSCMTELVKNALTKTDLSEKEEKHKNCLLDMIIAHTNDVSSHVRSRSVKLLNELLQANSLPIDRQPEIITAVSKRLLDPTATVRKIAVQYLIDYVDYNTYLSSISPSDLESMLEQKRQVVADLKEQIGVDQKTIEEWDEVSAKMILFFRKKKLPSLPDDPNELERPKGTIQEVLGNVTSLLDGQDFIGAIKLIQRCSHWFPECDIFKQPTAVASDEAEEGSNGEKSDESESEENSTDAPHEKTPGPDPGRWFSLAQRIYLREPPKRSKKIQNIDEHDEMSITEEPTEQEAQTETEILLSKLTKHEKDLSVLNHLKHYFNVYDTAVRYMALMLQSKTASDILIAIAFFVHLMNSNVPIGTRNISNMAHLYDHKEESVKHAVESAFESLYLTCGSSDVRTNSVNVARKLIELFMACTTVEMQRWGRVISELVVTKKIPSDVVLVFFEIATEKLGKEQPISRITALLLLSKCSEKKATIVEKNLATLVELMKEPQYMKYCTMSLSNLDFEKRWSNDNEAFSTIRDVLVQNLSNIGWNDWSSAFHTAMVFFFKAAAQPIKLVSETVNDVMEAWTDRQSAIQHSRILAMVQSIASRLYVFLDIDYYGKLQENKNKKKKKNFKRKSLSGSRNNSLANISMSEEGDSALVGAVADESEAEFINELMELEIMSDKHFLGSFIGHTVNLLKHPKNATSGLLQQATVTLISLMLLSNKVYDEHIAFVFTMLERSPDEEQRICIVTYIPDLCKAFPNSFDPWTAKVYEVLKRESNLRVRRKCIVVLSDLIMHDQIKVKGTISDVACSLLDDQPAIVRLTETLFQQLATKNNSLYNVLPDIISRLSDDEHGVSQEDFRKIIGFLFKQLGKDKKLENFVEKLCGRFRSSTTDVQCQNLAFCLKQISYTERSLRKLIDNVSCFADKLIDPAVSDCFDSICQQTAKGSKNELKLVVSELENALDEARNKGTTENESEDGLTQRRTMSQRPVQRNSQRTDPNRRATKTPKTKKKTVSGILDSDSEEEDFQPAARHGQDRQKKRNTETPVLRKSKRNRQ